MQSLHTFFIKIPNFQFLSQKSRENKSVKKKTHRNRPQDLAFLRFLGFSHRSRKTLLRPRSIDSSSRVSLARWGTLGAVGITAGGGIRIQLSPRLKSPPQFSSTSSLLSSRRRSPETATFSPPQPRTRRSIRTRRLTISMLGITLRRPRSRRRWQHLITGTVVEGPATCPIGADEEGGGTRVGPLLRLPPTWSIRRP